MVAHTKIMILQSVNKRIILHNTFQKKHANGRKIVKRLQTTGSQKERQTFFQWYSSKLESHPLTTKCITSGVIAAAGDFTCQYLQFHFSPSSTSFAHFMGWDSNDEQQQVVTDKSSSRWDKMKTLRFGLLGAFFVAPLVHYWYHYLNKVPILAIKIPKFFPSSWQKNSLMIRTSVQKTVLDQLVFAPVLFIPLWLVSLSALETIPLTSSPDAEQKSPNEDKNESTNDTVEEIKSKFLSQDYKGIVVANWFLFVPAMSVNFAVVPLKYQVLFGNCVAFLWNVYLGGKTSAAGKKESTNEDIHKIKNK